jgi:virginiamycin B lyase
VVRPQTEEDEALNMLCRIHAISVLLASCTLLGSAGTQAAQVVKCRDANGQMVLTQGHCPAGAEPIDASGATAGPGSRSTPIEKHAAATLKIPGYVDFLAAEGRAVWATNEGRVEKLQLDKAAPVATVAVPAPCGAMVVAFESLWVASCKDSSVYRIDLKSQKITARVPTGLADPDGELSLAAGAGSIWVLSNASGVLSRVDAATNTVIARVVVRPNSYAAAFGYDAVWITNTGFAGEHAAGSVQRIDPQTNEVTATIAVGPVPRFLAVGEGGVWTLNQGDGSVTRINPVTNRTVATIQAGMMGEGGDIATGAGAVWVRGSKVLLAAIDPATNELRTIYGPPAGSGAVRVAGDLVWVTAHDAKTVWVLRP